MRLVRPALVASVALLGGCDPRPAAEPPGEVSVEIDEVPELPGEDRVVTSIRRGDQRWLAEPDLRDAAGEPVALVFEERPDLTRGYRAPGGFPPGAYEILSVGGFPVDPPHRFEVVTYGGGPLDPAALVGRAWRLEGAALQPPTDYDFMANALDVSLVVDAADERGVTFRIVSALTDPCVALHDRAALDGNQLAWTVDALDLVLPTTAGDLPVPLADLHATVAWLERHDDLALGHLQGTVGVSAIEAWAPLCATLGAACAPCGLGASCYVLQRSDLQLVEIEPPWLHEALPLCGIDRLAPLDGAARRVAGRADRGGVRPPEDRAVVARGVTVSAAGGCGSPGAAPRPVRR